MEGNVPAGNMMPGASYGALGMQGNMHMRQGSMIQPSMSDGFPMSCNHLQETDHQAGVSIMDYNKGEHGKISLSDDDEPSLAEDGVDGQERGCKVSPQQCEDKFNDLNKRYKRLTDILGRGTSCRIVENPALLDHMTNLSEKLKDDVRKILSSKHLY
ncbi:hypothetical protein Cni_G19753 [Canna indica]|uniref:Myb/SANT-like DNA-binding domain-containing protein n=1 Tax=Canna indica TaxID=4628 RepID=A0AAQ3KL55_9LILI|nr:hypothetical protein Cni_G19753 [Canna indica]